MPANVERKIWKPAETLRRNGPCKVDNQKSQNARYVRLAMLGPTYLFPYHRIIRNLLYGSKSPGLRTQGISILLL